MVFRFSRPAAYSTSAAILAAMILVTSSSEVFADDSTVAADSATSKAKIPKSEPTRQDIDEEITNAKLRAETGSKSLFSMQAALNYNGGSVNDPLGKVRPQLSPGTVENDPSKLYGTISGKYRMTDHDNLNIGVGVGWTTPTYEGQHGQMEDPYIAYGRTFKYGSVQNVLNVQFQKYTAQTQVNNNDSFETDIDHTFLTDIGKTKWQLGVDVAWTREFYSGSPVRDDSAQDELAAFPFAEYAFNDNFSFRTVYRGFTYFNTAQNSAAFVRDDITQSMGLGCSITRDIYLYPNVQWVWGDVRSDKTNVALTAYVNL
jgi:hypothetical protein